MTTAAAQPMAADAQTSTSTDAWTDVGALADIPRQGAQTVRRAGHVDIGLFRTLDDRVFALENRCPHKQGPLSQGIVHGHFVACPLHDWRISLVTGEAQAPDRGCVPVIPVRVDNGRILLALNGALE
jgi:nitrite reductase (NADH) small subunit